jgi:hypothetical protein
MPLKVPAPKRPNPGSQQASKREERNHQRALIGIALRLFRDTVFLRVTDGPTFDSLPITETGWMGVAAHHRAVQEFTDDWKAGRPLHKHLGDFNRVPFIWKEEYVFFFALRLRAF